MDHPPNLLPLKVFVIVLGVLLIGGFMFLVVVISTRLHGETAGAECKDAHIALGKQENLISIVPQGANVQLVVKDAQGSKVLTADRCTGAIVQTLRVVQ